MKSLGQSNKSSNIALTFEVKLAFACLVKIPWNIKRDFFGFLIDLKNLKWALEAAVFFLQNVSISQEDSNGKKRVCLNLLYN